MRGGPCCPAHACVAPEAEEADRDAARARETPEVLRIGVEVSRGGRRRHWRLRREVGRRRRVSRGGRCGGRGRDGDGRVEAGEREVWRAAGGGPHEAGARLAVPEVPAVVGGTCARRGAARQVRERGGEPADTPGRGGKGRRVAPAKRGEKAAGDGAAAGAAARNNRQGGEEPRRRRPPGGEERTRLRTGVRVEGARVGVRGVHAGGAVGVPVAARPGVAAVVAIARLVAVVRGVAVRRERDLSGGGRRRARPGRRRPRRRRARAGGALAVRQSGRGRGGGAAVVLAVGAALSVLAELRRVADA